MSTALSPRYPQALIALHWLMLLLIAAAYALMEFRGEFPRGSEPRELMKAIHYSTGLSVLLLVMARLLLRFRGPIPPITPTPALALRLSAHAAHAALYVFMLGMPLLGWLVLSAEAAPISLWGLSLPALIGPDKALAERFEDLHKLGATLGYWLIGLHAAAGLYHHYLRRDDTLRRMLPWARALR
jgi:cytochrome b561